MQQAQNIYIICSIIYIAFTIIAMLAGVFVFKKEVIKATNEIQKHTSDIQSNAISAMEQEISVLRSRITDIEREHKKAEQIILTICDAMKKRGLDSTIDGNVVTVKDGNQTSTVRITGV